MMRREVTFKITFPAWLRRRHLAALVLVVGLLSAGAYAAPLALQTFSAGEALSSSAINQNFAAVQAVARSVDSGQYVADGSDDVDHLQAALDQEGRSAVLLPPGVFDLGTKGLVVPSGKRLEGSEQRSVLLYSGSDCAIKLDSTVASVLRGLNVQVKSQDPKARGICLRNTTADLKFNVVEDSIVLQTGQPTPIAGQVGLLLEATTTHALYWNEIRHNQLGTWDRAIRLVGVDAPARNGPNQNALAANLAFASEIGLDLSTATSDNTVAGFFCSASGYGGSSCVQVGDGTSASFNNYLSGVVSDQGTSARAYTIRPGASGTYVQADNQSGHANIDNGSNSTTIELYAATSFSRVGRLTVGAGVAPDGGGLKHARGAVGCSTGGGVGAVCTSGTIQWATPFADASYTVSCTLEGVTGQPYVVGVSNRSAGGFNLSIGAGSAAAASANYACIAIHD